MHDIDIAYATNLGSRVQGALGIVADKHCLGLEVEISELPVVWYRSGWVRFFFMGFLQLPFHNGNSDQYVLPS